MPDNILASARKWLMGASLSKQPGSTSETAFHSEDTVIPFRYLDNQSFLKQFTLVFTYRFDAVLSAEKLRDALQRLLETDDWRQLGARVKKTADGKLEYHVPPSFDEERPAFAWSHVSFNKEISEHALGRQFPQAAPNSQVPQLFDDAAIFVPLIESDNTPRKIEDWTSSDKPLLSFHVVSFTDATLVTVSWCHAFMDGSGIASLMTAWTAKLAGVDRPVPPVVPLDRDPVDLLRRSRNIAPETYVLHEQRLTGVSFARFAAWQMWEAVRYPKVEGRMMCLPASFIVKLREQARAQVSEFVSDGDVVSAWITRTTASALALAPSTPVGMTNVLDARDLVGKDILPAESAYIGNMCIQYLTYVQAGELLEESLGAIARRIRIALQEQRTEEQFAAYLAAHEQATAAGQVYLCGPSDMVMINISSWHKAKFFEYDFSPAVERRATGRGAEGERAEGKPTYISATGHEFVPLPSRNVGCLVGKDADDNWWMNWTMRKSAWPAFVCLATETA